MDYTNALQSFAQRSFFCYYFYAPLYTKYITMGKGDKKTKKGKIFKGSFGKARPASDKKITGTKPAEKKEG